MNTVQFDPRRAVRALVALPAIAAAACFSFAANAQNCPAAGSCFVAHGTPGCDNAACCQVVCAQDFFCCNNQWDLVCVDQANQLCAQTVCPPSNHNCFTTGGPGCSNVQCCLQVCVQDPFCCSNQWDQACVNQAADLCDGCGDPTAGDCCAPHPTPFCDNRTCCQQVCSLDPFCCNNQWDQTCVNQAETIAVCNCGPPPCNGRIDFGTTPDDGGNPNACTAAGPIVITTQYIASQAIVFGTAVDKPGVPPVGIVDDGACDPSCRSSGLPAYASDWWAQFRFADGTRAGVTVFSCELCFIDGLVKVVGYDNDCVAIASAATTVFDTETVTIAAPPGTLIAYVQVVASDPARPGGVSVDCLNYDGPFPRPVDPCLESTESCFVAHGSPGCNDTECCNVVCAQDPFCCDVAWDQLCKDQANQLCGNCGSPNAGCCFAPHPGPGCNNPACCRAVCQVDPFCCETAWDNACANQAEVICAGCRADFNGDGIVSGADLGLLLAAWGTGAPCFDLNNDGMVNGADLGLLLAAWGPCTL